MPATLKTGYNYRFNNLKMFSLKISNTLSVPSSTFIFQKVFLMLIYDFLILQIKLSILLAVGRMGLCLRPP